MVWSILQPKRKGESFNYEAALQRQLVTKQHTMKGSFQSATDNLTI